MRNLLLALTALAGAALAASDAQARNYETRLPQARGELNRADREMRFPLAAARCQGAIEARDADWMKPWCNLAVQQAMQDRERQQRAAFTDVEQYLLLSAAWLHAVDGLPELTPGQIRHPIETVPLGAEADTLRASAYRILADIRSHRTSEIWRSFQAMTRRLGVPMQREDSMQSVRQRLLTAVLAEPRAPEQLWAAAAIALTSEYEFPAGQTLERLRSESAALALLIAPLRAEAEGLEGADTALAPLLAYAHATLLQQARQLADASRVYGEGRDMCFARLWRTADLCMELDYLGVLAGHQAQDEIDFPELAGLPYPPKLAGRMRGVAYTEERCRVITVGDINDAGVLADLRVIYRLGPPSCLNISNEYISTLRYPPIAQAQPGQRRQGIIVNFQLRSE